MADHGMLGAIRLQTMATPDPRNPQQRQQAMADFLRRAQLAPIKPLPGASEAQALNDRRRASTSR